MSKKIESVEIEMTTGVSNSNVLRFSPDSDDEDDGRGYVSFSSRQPIAPKFFVSDFNNKRNFAPFFFFFFFFFFTYSRVSLFDHVDENARVVVY